MSTLTSKAVNDIFMYCLFSQGEESLHSSAVTAYGITLNIGFHPGRLQEKTPEIKSLLDELPINFKFATEKNGGGGGWSFINACVDKNDHQWGEQKNVQELLLLGLASKYVSYVFPREVWSSLPGSMPYFSIHEVQQTD